MLGVTCSSVDEDEDQLGCHPGHYGVEVYSLADEGWEGAEVPASLGDVTDESGRLLGATSDGRVVMLLYASADTPSGLEEQFWTYAPGDGAWEQLPTIGEEVDDQCLAGDSIATVATTEVASGASGGYVDPVLRTLALDHRGTRWEEASPAPRDPEEIFAQLGCGDDFAAVHSGVGQVLELHPTGAGRAGEDWEVAPPPPGRYATGDLIWTGRELLFFLPPSTGGLAYEPATQRWRRVPFDNRAGDPVWAGDAIVGWVPGRGPVVIEVSRPR